MPKKRSEVDKNDKWNIEALFENDEKWQNEYNLLKNEIKNIIRFKGKLKESEKNILDMLEYSVEIARRIDKLYTYAHMKHDEDIKNDIYKSQYDIAINLYTDFSEISSYIEPELLSIDDEIMKKYLESKVLEKYKFYLEKIIRTKNHTLSENEEKLLSMVSNALTASYDAFKALSDGDIKFEDIVNSKNEKLPLTHSNYQVYIISRDREIREKAFRQYHEKFNEYPATMASLLYGKIKEHVFYSKARNFMSTLEASMFYKNIDTSVYLNLIETVRKKIKVLHEYLKYRKEKMKVNELHLYDLYVPFIDAEEFKINYDKAAAMVLDSITVLGDEYKNVLSDGLKKYRWVDRYENENKRSGAYSTGCYDSMPYILMNYNETLNSVRTLAHEAGHSMHTYYSNKYQQPIYSQYPIFVAEVASTFNEELLNTHLITNAKNKKEKAYLINSRLEEIRATLFRQTMFAEFELIIHQLVENNTPLTFQLLKKEYKKLNEFYFGNEVIIDNEIEIEWARIPHFYYNYYVYQYATGISASIALFKRVLNGGESEKNDYLNFLKSGSSKFPIDILKNAGVDMTTDKPVDDAINYFEELLNQLINLEG
ncbi:MAG: oligoendopeptidase F [Spirochaetes bacterium]|nr:oligoendopeptidase F [Spirochaetota bacterium]